MKLVKNSPQNTRNCTIFKNFLGAACLQTPLTKARSFAARDMPLCGMYIQNPRNFKVGPPPLRNPVYTPDFGYFTFTETCNSLYCTNDAQVFSWYVTITDLRSLCN